MKCTIENSMRHMLRGMAVAVCLVAGVMPAEADGINHHYVISKKFSYSGKPQISVIDRETNTASIYDENMNLVKTVSYKAPKTYTKIVTEERLIVPGEYVDSMQDEHYTPVSGLEEVIIIANASDLKSHTKKGNVHTFLPIELPEGEGGYSKIIYTEGEDHFMLYYIHRYPKYSDWQVTDERTHENSYEFNYQYLYNYDADIIADDNEFFLTQTMFNNDDKYEYVAPVYEIAKEGHLYNSDYVWHGNERIEIKRETRYYSQAVRYDVMSEDGNVIMSIHANVLDFFFLYGGKVYACTLEYTPDGEKESFYAIDSQTNAIQTVQADFVKIFPRMAGRGESITVETAVEAAGQRREVVVTSMDGRIVSRVAVPAGETVTHINTSRMAGGVYNFTVYAGGKNMENGKIVIR